MGSVQGEVLRRRGNPYTVIEINARDRAALLCDLAEAVTESRMLIHSAHVATYGERAVDVFYLTDLAGSKIDNAARLKALQGRLLKAATAAEADPLVPA